MADLRFRLINEVIRAQGVRHKASCRPHAAGHNTDRCPITMLMIAGPGSDNHIQSFFYQITIRSAHATDGFPDEELFESICGTSTPTSHPHPQHHQRCCSNWMVESPGPLQAPRTDQCDQDLIRSALLGWCPSTRHKHSPGMCLCSVHRCSRASGCFGEVGQTSTLLPAPHHHRDGNLFWKVTVRQM